MLRNNNLSVFVNEIWNTNLIDRNRIILQLKIKRLQVKNISKFTSVNNFTYSGLMCQCQGVIDYNDMFSIGFCGYIASCDLDTGICRCLRL